MTNVLLKCSENCKSLGRKSDYRVFLNYYKNVLSFTFSCPQLMSQFFNNLPLRSGVYPKHCIRFIWKDLSSHIHVSLAYKTIYLDYMMKITNTTDKQLRLGSETVHFIFRKQTRRPQDTCWELTWPAQPRHSTRKTGSTGRLASPLSGGPIRTLPGSIRKTATTYGVFATALALCPVLCWPSVWFKCISKQWDVFTWQCSHHTSRLIIFQEWSRKTL